MPLANPTEREGETPYCIVLTTVSSEELAQALARQIVEARLGACVQIDRIQSVYRWNDQFCSEPEYRLMIKTRNARFQALAQFIRAHHPYEVPEIVQIPVAGGSADYLRWVDEGTQSSNDPPPGRAPANESAPRS